VPDDGSVFEALRRGDETAFARLVDHSHASLGRVARLSETDAVANNVSTVTFIAIRALLLLRMLPTVAPSVMRVLSGRP
jgi:hypothetical protein